MAMHGDIKQGANNIKFTVLFNPSNFQQDKYMGSDYCDVFTIWILLQIWVYFLEIVVCTIEDLNPLAD